MKNKTKLLAPGLRRLHPAAAVLFFRRWVLLCLAPLAPVLLRREWAALADALRQNAALLAALGLASWLLLRGAGWALDAEDVLHLRWGLGPHAERQVPAGAIAAVTLERGPFLQLAGAALVTIYPTGGGRAFAFCLPQRQAGALAQRLLPLQGKPVRRRPAGAERLAVALLGSSGLSSVALALLAVQRSRRLPGAQDLALAQLERMAALAARWMPAGMAWLLAAAALWYGLNLARAADHAAACEALRCGGVLCGRGGLWRRREVRLRLDQLQYAELRASPAGWLLGRRPLYLCAGAWRAALPLAAPRAGQLADLDALLPGLDLPPRRRADTRRRSRVFFTRPGAGFGFCALLALLARRLLPALTVPLAMLAGGFALLLCGALAGYLREGAWPQRQRLTLCAQRGLRLHYFCIYPAALRAAGMELRQTPWGLAAQRADLVLRLPGRGRIKARSIPLREADACLELLHTHTGKDDLT